MSDVTARTARPAALTPDICVVGAGTRGIAIATAAAAFGVSVVLVERGETGGREGDLAIEALVQAGARAQDIREAGRLGMTAEAPVIHPARLHDHIQRALSVAAANHRAERLRALGITLVHGEARFVSRSTLSAGEQTIKARRFVLATGSRPQATVPGGLDPAGLLTEDDLASITRLPERLIVLGSDGRAIAIAQAFRRLGSSAVLLAHGGLLPGWDAEAVMILRRRLLREGIELEEDRELLRAEATRSGVRVVLAANEGQATLEGNRLLVTGSRAPDIDGLDLDLAGIRQDAAGIVVDAGLRTANRRVCAVGSCAGGAAAGSGEQAGDGHVGIVLRNALFRKSGSVRPSACPRVVWSSPPIASVGTLGTPDEDRPGTLRFLRWPFAEVPGALAAGDGEGFVKLAVDRGGRVRGATIVGRGAPELIAPWCAAVAAGLKVQDMAELPVPALSLSEGSRRAASAFYLPMTTNPAVRRLIGFLRRFG